MTDAKYELVVTALAVRSIEVSLPETVAFVVIDFITGPLLDNPRRVGAPLRGELEGIWSARRGTYRVPVIEEMSTALTEAGAPRESDEFVQPE